MPHIAQLSPHVADLIAAGEVVERPASVVKELVENAVDAGANSVTVEIQNGGMTLIRVTDDGCGIAPDEAETAFLRHATSKIKSEYDLEAIGTLGFRGEALAAVAAVARVELLTRRQEDELGTSLAIEGGMVAGKEEAGCPQGTTLLVRDLFYNTPARLKFMKKDAAEGAACLAALQRQALAHPEVSFKFIRDGKQELLTPGDGQLRSCMYAVLGRDMALGFQPVEGGDGDVRVSGFTSLPTCCRGTRGYQFFFVNGRYIKSATLTAAVEQAYANQKMVGKFPGCVLHLTVKLNAVDVNVHPTKQEVKFGQERAVFSAVYYAVLSALDADHAHPQASVGTPRPAGGGPLSQPRDTVTKEQVRLPLHDITSRRPAPAVPIKAESVPTPVRSAGPALRESPRPSGTEDKPLVLAPKPEPVREIPPEAQVREAEKKAETSPEVPAASAVSAPPAKDEAAPPADQVPWRVAGELFHTYIIVEQGDRAYLIDKHAAHERMNFDRMRAQDYIPMSQELLSPVVFTPQPQEGQALLDNLSRLEELGFGVEDFGVGSIAVRRVPDYVDPGDVEATLTELAGRLLSPQGADDRERQDELLHTMACKAAIKGGWKSAPQELERVAAAVMAGEVKYCPHGRPVAIELTQKQLEKQFKRA